MPLRRAKIVAEKGTKLHNRMLAGWVALGVDTSTARYAHRTTYTRLFSPVASEWILGHWKKHWLYTVVVKLQWFGLRDALWSPGRLAKALSSTRTWGDVKCGSSQSLTQVQPSSFFSLEMAWVCLWHESGTILNHESSWTILNHWATILESSVSAAWGHFGSHNSCKLQLLHCLFGPPCWFNGNH